MRIYHTPCESIDESRGKIMGKGYKSKAHRKMGCYSGNSVWEDQAKKHSSRKHKASCIVNCKVSSKKPKVLKKKPRVSRKKRKVQIKKRKVSAKKRKAPVKKPSISAKNSQFLEDLGLKVKE